MDEVLKSEEENVVIACGVNNKKATLITLRFETKEEFSKVLGILEKYAKPKNAEMGSLSQEKVSEVKSKFKEHFEMGSKKTGNVPPELRTSVSVANPYFTSRNPNPDSPSISQSSSVQDSSSITVITLTNGESTPSYTNGMITLPRKNSASEDDNRFDGNSLKGFPIFSKREQMKAMIYFCVRIKRGLCFYHLAFRINLLLYGVNFMNFHGVSALHKNSHSEVKYRYSRQIMGVFEKHSFVMQLSLKSQCEVQIYDKNVGFVQIFILKWTQNGS
ncbi:hypothetical protein EGR_05997 [Echinococcus granulosus]|uniref:DUF5734 domain-containing protein n=1 Tax=Echinococcus granulosus TaxID=6210 RepID=W6UZP2_ECHGR|nr:hypothetical protein EGR_05997 [Echinococcus granulosus]EUB59134.1 hypothetical protein EGR_05997 [Echinococcus granulosus]